MIHYELRKIGRQPLFYLVFAVCLMVCLYEYRVCLRMDSSGDIYQNDYRTYLSEILEDIRHQQAMTQIFGGKDSSGKSLEMGYQAYSDLMEIVIEKEPARFIEPVFQNRVYRLAILLLAIVITFFEVFKDRIYHVDQLVFTTPKGERSVLYYRLAISCGICVVFLIFAKALGIAIGACVYGKIGFFKPLQMITMFYNSPLKLSIAGALLLDLAADLIWISYAVLLSFFFAILFENLVTALLALAIYLLVNAVLFLAIGEWSYLKPLRGMSFFSQLAFEKYMSSWDVIVIGDFLIESWKLTMFVNLVAACLLTVLILHLWKHKIVIRLRENGFLRRLSANLCAVFGRFTVLVHERRSLTLSFLEGKLAFIYMRAWLIGLCLLTIEAGYYMSEVSHMDEAEFYYQSYSQDIEGPLTGENLENIRELTDQLYNAGIDIEALRNQLEQGLISESYFDYLMRESSLSQIRREAIERIKDQTERLLQNQEEGIKVEYVIDSPYKRYLRSDYWHYLDLLCFYGSILIYSINANVYEKRSNMRFLINSRKDGAKKIWKNKKKYRIAVVTAFWLITCVPRIVWIFSNYKVSGLMAPCRSISFLDSFPLNIPIIFALTLVLLLRLMTGLLLTGDWIGAR